MNSENNEFTEIQRLKKIISEKDEKIKYFTKKIHILQNENKLFQTQIINFQKTFDGLTAANSYLRSDDVIYFLHIPKTAGTSLITILDGYFESNSVLKPHDWQQLMAFMPVDFSKYRFVRGHFGYSIMRYLPKKTKCITMLRNPSDTILSNVKMIRRQPRDANRFAIKENYTISEILLKCEIKIIQNPQTKWLLLDQDIYSRMKEMDSITARDVYRPLEDEKMFPYQSQSQYMNMVKRRLLEFSFIGIVEDMEKSLFLLHYTFGWKPIRNFVRENASPVEDQIEELTDEAKEKIKEYLLMDQEIYTFGRKIFEERYSKMVQELKTKFYESKFDALEPNDMVFELLKLDYAQKSKVI